MLSSLVGPTFMNSLQIIKLIEWKEMVHICSDVFYCCFNRNGDSVTGGESVGCAVSSATHSFGKYYYRNLCWLGHLHRNRLRKSFLYLKPQSPSNLLSSVALNGCCDGLTGKQRPAQASLAVWNADGISSQRGGRLFCRRLVSLDVVYYCCCLAKQVVTVVRLPFFLSSRLYVLQGGLAQQEWRVPELLHRLLQYLEPKLTQVYKNVRERIGRWVYFFNTPDNPIMSVVMVMILVCIIHQAHCDLLSFQRAHVHLHDWCQLAVHSPNYLPAHRRLHRANPAAAEASHRGGWGNPEPCRGGERGGGAGWEDASNQVAQNRSVSAKPLHSKKPCLCQEQNEL